MPTPWCLVCGKTHDVRAHDVVRSCEIVTNPDGSGSSQQIHRTGQLDISTSPAAKDVTLRLWVQEEASEALLSIGECSTWSPSSTLVTLTRENIACIVFHVACAVSCSFDVPAAMHHAMDACAWEVGKGNQGHVSIEAYPQSMLASKRPAPTAVEDDDADEDAITIDAAASVRHEDVGCEE